MKFSEENKFCKWNSDALVRATVMAATQPKCKRDMCALGDAVSAATNLHIPRRSAPCILIHISNFGRTTEWRSPQLCSMFMQAMLHTIYKHSELHVANGQSNYTVSALSTCIRSRTHIWNDSAIWSSLWCSPGGLSATLHHCTQMAEVEIDTDTRHDGRRNVDGNAHIKHIENICYSLNCARAAAAAAAAAIAPLRTHYETRLPTLTLIEMWVA